MQLYNNFNVYEPLYFITGGMAQSTFVNNQLNTVAIGQVAMCIVTVLCERVYTGVLVIN